MASSTNSTHTVPLLTYENLNFNFYHLSCVLFVPSRSPRDTGFADIPEVIVDGGDTTDAFSGPVFPDPGRKGKEVCETSLDCPRLVYCDKRVGFKVCRQLQGCGLFGEPPEDEDWSCVINPLGGEGVLSGVECQNDDVCPPSMPYCYLRACQINPPCSDDSDSRGRQYCDWGAWCVDPKPCKSDSDCPDKCGKEGFCDPPAYH